MTSPCNTHIPQRNNTPLTHSQCKVNRDPCQHLSSYPGYVTNAFPAQKKRQMLQDASRYASLCSRSFPFTCRHHRKKQKAEKRICSPRPVVIESLQMANNRLAIWHSRLHVAPPLIDTTRALQFSVQPGQRRSSRCLFATTASVRRTPFGWWCLVFVSA